MKQLLKSLKYLNWFWLLLFFYFFYLMLEITLRYIPFQTDVAFLQIKQEEVHSIQSYLAFFYIHVYSSIFALLAGFTQFNETLLKNYPKTHRIIGTIYVYVVLFLAAPSGLFIGYFANGGFWAKISFLLLGTLWFAFTLKGVISIKKGFIEKHKNFMLRSFALTFSAITLRVWKVILVFLYAPNPMDVYKIIAWLGWIPNLLLIEWWINKNRKL